MPSIQIKFFSNLEKSNRYFVRFVGQRKKQLFIYFSKCLCAQYIWNQTQIFSGSILINIPDVTPPQSAISCFTETSTKDFLLINHLKCYLCKPRDPQNLSFLAFKERIMLNSRRKNLWRRKVLKKRHTYVVKISNNKI